MRSKRRAGNEVALSASAIDSMLASKYLPTTALEVVLDALAVIVTAVSLYWEFPIGKSPQLSVTGILSSIWMWFLRRYY